MIACAAGGRASVFVDPHIHARLRQAEIARSSEAAAREADWDFPKRRATKD
jgi:hypothetical protein